MKTITIQIGNSDNKLSQYDWSEFIRKTGIAVDTYSDNIFFTGFSSPMAIWQNACWVFSLGYENYQNLKLDLEDIRKEFQQESIAFTEGETTFING